MSTDDYGRLRLPFRFTRPADVKAYGRDNGEPWVYDEAELFELPVKRLAEIETALDGYSIPELVRDFRNDRILGRHAASWVAIHLADPDTAGAYDAYQPAVMMIAWDFFAQDGEEPTPLDSSDSTTSPPEG